MPRISSTTMSRSVRTWSWSVKAHSPGSMARKNQTIPNPEHLGGTSCIFLRRDQKCALQVAAEENGEHPWRFKPFYCILHPLDLDEDSRITLDEIELMLDEPTSCLQYSRQEIPLQETFKNELDYLLGRKLK
jgi:hypothetical protein